MWPAESCHAPAVLSNGLPKSWRKLSRGAAPPARLGPFPNPSWQPEGLEGDDKVRATPEAAESSLATCTWVFKVERDLQLLARRMGI